MYSVPNYKKCQQGLGRFPKQMPMLSGRILFTIFKMKNPECDLISKSGKCVLISSGDYVKIQAGNSWEKFINYRSSGRNQTYVCVGIIQYTSQNYDSIYLSFNLNHKLSSELLRAFSFLLTLF